MRSGALAWLFAVALGALGAMQAGEGPSTDVAAFLPEQPCLRARLNDLARTRERFAASPYAALVRTAWGAALLERLHRGASSGELAGIDPLAIAGSLGEVAVGVAMKGKRAEIGIAAHTTGVITALQAWCSWLLGAEARPGPAGTDLVWLAGAGQLSQQGALMIFQSAPAEGGAVEAARFHPAVPSSDGQACIEAQLDTRHFAQLFALLDADTVPVPSGPPLQLGFTASVDPIGVRERLVLGSMSENALAAVRALMARPADLGLLRDLPGTTLCALVAHADAAASRAALAKAGYDTLDTRVEGIDDVLAALGLPGVLRLLGALDGDLLLYVEEGAPLPYATLAAGMRREMAEQLLAILTKSCALQATGAGMVSGLVGPVLLAGGYRDGQLVLTTNPAGLAGFAHRAPGFTAHPEVMAALTELRPGAVAAGVSRSGALWSTFARLAWLSLAPAGSDARLATLGEDLRAQARHGFLSLALVDHDLVLDGGGLAGGAVSTLMLASAISAWCEEGLTLMPEAIALPGGVVF